MAEEKGNATIARKNDGEVIPADLLSRVGIDEATYVQGVRVIMATCREAWLAGMMTGFNGNMSLRPGGTALLVTGTGVAKGHLSPRDVSLAESDTGILLFGRPVSSETAMHVAAYQACPESRCVLHTHPTALLALSLLVPGEKMLDLPLFEAGVWRERLTFAAAAEPGSLELALNVGRACAQAPAVFMEGHGLCVHAGSSVEALGITEQLEHLARIQLSALAASLA